MIGDNFIRKASGFYAPSLIGLAGKWKLQACGVGECCFAASQCEDCALNTDVDDWSPTISVTVPGYSAAPPHLCDDVVGDWEIDLFNGASCYYRIISAPFSYVGGYVEAALPSGTCFAHVIIGPTVGGIKGWWARQIPSPPVGSIDMDLDYVGESSPYDCGWSGTTAHITIDNMA